MKECILVTGGFGFQGSHLVELLLKEGRTVKVLSRDSEDARRNSLLISPHKNLIVLWGDITSYETVRAFIRDCTTVVHLAAQINVDESIKFPERSLRVNTIGTWHILKAALEVNSLRKKEDWVRIIHGSTCEVYGSNTTSGLMTELHPLNPQSPYAASKAGSDVLVHSFCMTYKLPVAILRPGNVYGPRQKSGEGGAVIPKWMALAKSGRDLIVFGDGQQSRDWIFVSDVVKAYKAVIDNFSRVVGETLNIGTGYPCKLIDIAKMIAAFGDVEIVHKEGRQGEVQGFALDSTKATKLLNWTPSIYMLQGLQMLWESFEL